MANVLVEPGLPSCRRYLPHHSGLCVFLRPRTSKVACSSVFLCRPQGTGFQCGPQLSSLQVSYPARELMLRTMVFLYCTNHHGRRKSNPTNIIEFEQHFSTYGHRLMSTGHPVRSGIHKHQTGRLVLEWVTTVSYTHLTLPTKRIV